MSGLIITDKTVSSFQSIIWRLLGMMILLAGSTGTAQTWPLDLQMPQVLEPDDSSGITITADQSINRAVFKSTDSVIYEQNDSLRYFRQLVFYKLKYDGQFRMSNQELDFSGSTLFKQTLVPWLRIGMDWSPHATYSSDTLGGFMQGAFDVGPSVLIKPIPFPLRLKGGFSGRIWNELIPVNPLNTSYADFSTDRGFFGALEYGSTQAPLFIGTGLWGSLQAYGRHTGRANLAWARAGLLYGTEVFAGDSILLAVADTVSSGNDASLRQAGGSVRYVADPENTTHSLRVAGAFKGASLFFVKPTLGYAYALSSRAYPAVYKNYLDEMNSSHTVCGALATDSSITIQYAGTFTAKGEQKNALFLSPVGERLTAFNAESLQVNLNDCDQFSIATEHHIALFSPESLGISYDFILKRNSKTYPRFYSTIIDTIRNILDTTRNVNDYDWIMQSHRLTVVPLKLPICIVSMYGGYQLSNSSYLRKELSKDNSIDRTFRLGGSLTVIPLQPLQVGIKVDAEARTTEFSFPYAYWYDGSIDDDYPPMSRVLNFSLSAQWQVLPVCTLKGQWAELYWDEGTWVGKQYLDDRRYTAQTRSQMNEYYALDKKWLTSSLDFSLVWVLGDYNTIEIGSQAQDVYYRVWSDSLKIFDINSLGSGYVLMPYVSGNFYVTDKLSAQLKIKRYIDTIADDYWDLLLLCSIAL